MLKLVLIALGGGLGTLARYGVTGFAHRLSESHLPVGTLVVNLVGCLLIGVIAAYSMGPTALREEYRWALTVGFLGGFTTFAAFGFETFALFENRHTAVALANVILSNVGGLGAVWLGYRLASLLRDSGAA
ncbi:MAG: fluoride efflux transporter CrcB [Myxococcota bacterium]|nr:fluoride efflux transporter CrcB [Myxococcota bacterium]